MNKQATKELYRKEVREYLDNLDNALDDMVYQMSTYGGGNLDKIAQKYNIDKKLLINMLKYE